AKGKSGGGHFYLCPFPFALEVNLAPPLTRSAMAPMMPSIMNRSQAGPVNLTLALLLIGLVVAGVWIWKRIPLDTQDYIIEQAIPLGLLILGIAVLTWKATSKLRHRKTMRLKRERLIARFEREQSPEKRLDLAFALIELNLYRQEGLEQVTPAMVALFSTTLRTALGDKQHRLRGMAASHLGVLQDRSAIPLLLKALEDDHAYVRGSAALGLGRVRAVEAKSKLREVMQEDWDQTVRSRAREALERME
ncbi:MAG: HEAT repeat domain-containing protein, partial [Nitrospiraceae bacterium]